MAEEGLDRRSQRTREALIHALLELIETRHYDQITVQDIVGHANVGRATFYAHYQSKDDLLTSGFEHMLDMLVQHITVSEEGQLGFNTSMLFQHAHGHYEIYRTLIWGSGFGMLAEDGHAALSRKIEDRLMVLLSEEQSSSIPLPTLAYFMAGALLLLLKWWLDNKMPHSPERMNEIFQQLIMPGIRGVLGSREDEG